MLAATLCICAGCSRLPQENNFNSLIQSSQKSRSLGHEDAAANDLKEAFEKLPPRENAQRVQSVNQLYPEILALASALRQSGRFSLSKTLLDMGIEIEPECTIDGKQSARALKEETEKFGDMEISLLKRADKAKELRQELKQLKHTTKDLSKAFLNGEYKQVARTGRAHLETLRKTRGAASNAYCDARRIVVQSMLYDDNTDSAIKLLEDDIPELSNFKDEDLKNADEESVESALFLSPLLSQIADLQFSMGRYQQAEKNARRSFELAVILGGKMDQDSALSQVVLANILRVKGKDKEALTAAESVMPYFDKSNGSRESWLRCLFTIAELEEALGQTRAAKKDFDRLIEAADHSAQPGNSCIALALAAAFYRQQGDERKYVQLRDKAIQSAAGKGEPRASLKSVYETLGDCSQRFSKFSEALGFYETALPYANKFQSESLGKKIASCKKNKSVVSYATMPAIR